MGNNYKVRMPIKESNGLVAEHKVFAMISMCHELVEEIRNKTSMLQGNETSCEAPGLVGNNVESPLETRLASLIGSLSALSNSYTE